jgi:UDP-N-acetylglucosamine--N-acetylmuramyl-(pentapeptide) pyrophosphoryl-undecaprenol N-acetylglucosamine transferase
MIFFMRILLTGGGTGGHITPLVAVARELKKISKEKGINNLELFYVGPDGMAKGFLAKEGIVLKTILAGKMRRYFSFMIFADIFKIFFGLIQAIWHVFWIMPDICFGKGGYGSFSAVIACWIFGVPILIHESDSVPGSVNRRLSGLVKRIAISFMATEKFFPQEKTALVGNPIRDSICRGQRDRAGQTLGLSGSRAPIFIFGGSQGAQTINEAVLAILKELSAKYEIIWQTGKKNYENILSEIKRLFGQVPAGCHIFNFLNEEQVADAFVVSDLIISRAGSANIFEIAACGKPSIIIPLPTAASDHQRENALEYARSGGAEIIEQQNLTPHIFLAEIDKIMKDNELRQRMSSGAKSFAKPEAGRMIAEELIRLANG